MAKILKIKVGEAFIDNKKVDIFQTAREVKSKKGLIYYEIRNPIFVHEIQDKIDVVKL